MPLQKLLNQSANPISKPSRQIAGAAKPAALFLLVRSRVDLLGLVGMPVSGLLELVADIGGIPLITGPLFALFRGKPPLFLSDAGLLGDVDAILDELPLR